MTELNIIIEILIVFISMFIFRAYLNTIFEYKDKSVSVHVAIWSLYTVVQLFANFYVMSNPYVNLFYNLALMVLVCFFAYSGKFYRKFIYCFLYAAIWIFIELSMTYAMMIMGVDYTKLQLMGSILTKVMLFIVIKIISRFVKPKENVNIPIKYWVILWLIPVSSIIGVTSIFTFVSHDNSSYVLGISFLIGAFMLFINVVVFFAYDKLTDGMMIEKKNIVYEQQLILCSKQAAEREESILDIRKIKHDMKNHLIYLREITDMGDKEKMVEYLDRLIMDTSVEKTGISRSANIVIDALVNYKYSVACKENIDFKVNIAVPYKLPYEDGDICIILGNALDNAIEATSKLPQDDRSIQLAIGSRKNVLSIVVKNSFNGEVKRGKNHRLLSTKIDTISHGIGLLSIQQAANKYNGEAITDINGNEFTLTIILYSSED